MGRQGQFPKRGFPGVYFVVVVMLASCSGHSDDVATTTSPVQAATTTVVSTATSTSEPLPKLSWTSCGQVRDGPVPECATLTVPLDHGNSSAGTIDLAVKRFTATEPEERIGVLLYNPGGPAARGTQWLSLIPFSDDLRNQFDLVSWDPRGTTEESTVYCGDQSNLASALDPTPESAEEEALIEERFRSLAAGCEQHSGHLLPYMSSVSTARDMDLLREALGEEEISYFGQSYGAGLGAVYATLFPERTRAMVLDGAFDFNAPLGERAVQYAEAQEKSLDAALGQCATDLSCPFFSGGDPFSALDDLMASLDAEPLMVNGSEVGLADVLFRVHIGLFFEERWPDLMQMLADMRNGDGSGWLPLGDIFVQPDWLSATAIQCLDWPRNPPEMPQATIDAVLAVAPRLGPFGVAGFDLCSVWPVEPDLPPPLTGAGAGPILLIGTTGDIATPLEAARDLAEHLEGSVLLVVERNSHLAYAPPYDVSSDDSLCVTATVDRFLIDFQSPATESVCRHGEPNPQPPT